MTGHLWLRSPAAHTTLTRAVVRYGRLAGLAVGNGGQKLALTADVELVRRTRALSLAAEGAHGEEWWDVCDVEDGDDGKEGRRRALAETALLYEGRYREEYGACLCWECEEMRRVCEEIGGGETGEEEDWDALAERVRKRVELYMAVEMGRRKGMNRGPNDAARRE